MLCVWCMVAIRGGYRIACGWHYTKLSLSSALLSFSGMFFVLLFFLFFSFLCSRLSFVDDVPLIFFLSSRPRTTGRIGNHVCILLGM